ACCAWSSRGSSTPSCGSPRKSSARVGDSSFGFSAGIRISTSSSASWTPLSIRFAADDEITKSGYGCADHPRPPRRERVLRMQDEKFGWLATATGVPSGGRSVPVASPRTASNPDPPFACFGISVDGILLLRVAEGYWGGWFGL